MQSNSPTSSTVCYPARSGRSAFLFAALILLAAPALLAQTSLTGIVSNAATGRTLEGARVVIPSLGREAVTDGQGGYRFDDLAPGNVVLSVSYTSLDSMDIPLTLPAGTPTRRDVQLTAAIYKLDKFVVAGEREGNALAITRQRQADNVKNVVSADAFGSLSGNPSELLERLPGVVVERVGGDPRYVSLRGTPGDLNSIQIDGNRRATAGERSLNFESIGSDFIESMELIKSPTPDMDADAIGGTVNLKSRSGFDLAARRITYALGIIQGFERYPAPIPAASFAYSDVLGVFGGRRNLGISFSTSFRQHLAAMDFTTMNYQRTENRPAYMYSLAFDGRMNRRTRWGGGLKLDYKLSETHALFASFTFSPHLENSVVPVTTVATAQTVATLNAQGQPTGTGAILPGYTDNRTEARALAASTVSLSNLHRQRDANAYSIQLGGRSQQAQQNLDYDASYSYSKNNQFLHTVTAILRGVGWVFDRTNTSRWTPRITYTGGPEVANLDNYTDNLLTRTHQPTIGRIYGSQVNYLRRFTLPVPAYVKTGLRYRLEKQDLRDNSRRWRFAGADGVLNSGDERLSQFQDLNLDYRPMHGVYQAGPILSPDAMRDHKDANLNRWQEDITFGTQMPLTGRRSLQESVSAGYVMGHVRIERFSILAGVRVERTDVEAEGALNQITPEERARRAAWVGVVTPDETVRRITAQYGTRRRVERDYQNVFPGRAPEIRRHPPAALPHHVLDEHRPPRARQRDSERQHRLRQPDRRCHQSGPEAAARGQLRRHRRVLLRARRPALLRRLPQGDFELHLPDIGPADSRRRWQWLRRRVRRLRTALAGQRRLRPHPRLGGKLPAALRVPAGLVERIRRLRELHLARHRRQLRHARGAADARNARGLHAVGGQLRPLVHPRQIQFPHRLRLQRRDSRRLQRAAESPPLPRGVAPHRPQAEVRGQPASRCLPRPLQRDQRQAARGVGRAQPAADDSRPQRPANPRRGERALLIAHAADPPRCSARRAYCGCPSPWRPPP
jgi:hypothetical protein